MYKNSGFQFILVLVCLIFHLGKSQFLQLIITPNVTQVQQSSTYDFVLNFYQITTIPAGSVIQIIFPIDYSSAINQNYNCSAILWLGNQNLVCTMQNRVLQIKGGFPADINQQDVTLQFTLINITNPEASGETGLFCGQLIASNSTILVSSVGFGDTTIVFNSGTLSMQTSVFPTTVNQISTLTVDGRTKHSIPKSGYLSMQISTYWASNVVNITQIINSSSQCFPLSNVSRNIVCTITSGTNQFINLAIKYLFDEDFSGNFSFTIFPFLNPPTIAPQGSFSLTSYNSLTLNQIIDSVSNQYISGLTFSDITSSKITFDSYIISSLTQATIQCHINNIISPNDKIYIQFPSQFILTNLTSIYAQNNAVTNLMISVGNLISFKNLILNSPGTVVFVMNDVVLPWYNGVFSGFSIKTERNSYGMDYVANPFVVKTLNGVLSGQLSAVSNEVGVVTDYQLTLTLSHMVNYTDFLTIQFAQLEYNFSLSNASTMGCVSSQTSNCTLSILSSNKLKLSNIFINLTTTLELTIKSIKNPYNLGLTTPIIITSYTTINSTDYSMDKSAQNSTVFSLNLTSRKLPFSKISISSTSDITYQRCDLSISISNQNPVGVNSYVDVSVPVELGVPSIIVCNFGCAIEGNSVTTTIVRIYLGSSAYSVGQLPVIEMLNVKNPQNTGPTSTFAVSIYNSQGQILEYTNVTQGGITYKVSTPSQFALMVTRNSSINSQSPVNYTFTITTLFPITSNFLIILEIPSLIACLSSCPIVYLNSTYYQLVSQPIITSNNIISLSYDMKNYYSFEPIVINVKIVTNDQLYAYGKGSATIVNNVASEIVASVAWTNQQLLVKGSMVISNISFAQYNINDSYFLMLISFGSDFDLSNATSTFTFTKTANSLSLQIPANSTLSQIEIQNLIYPSTSTSLPIYITTATSNPQYAMGKSTAIYWSINCNLPCKTCSSSNTSSCTSCYNSSVLVDGNILFQPSSNQCVRVCANQYYQNLTDNRCYPCSDQCYNCESFSMCTSCNSGSYLLRSNYTCFAGQCPPGYFIYYSNCQMCTQSLNCQTCTDSLSCTSCIDGFYYYQQHCLSHCPINITIENVFTNNCDPCPENCSTCQLSTNGLVECLSCQNGFLYDSGGCYQNCRTPGLVPNGNTCVSCSSACLTCQVNMYYCLTCNASSQYKYFFNNSCLISCPSGYYNSQTDPYLCLPCTQPCQSCMNSSVQSCLSCIQGYSLNGRICESTCSPMFYSYNGSCLGCVSPCKTCTARSICMTCQVNYLLFVDQCVRNCIGGYYSVNGQCLACSGNCKACSSVNYCTQCFSNLFLYQGQCLSTCPNEFYKNLTALTCDSCSQNCIYCLNQNYVSSQCVPTCSSDQYYNTTLRQCVMITNSTVNGNSTNDNITTNNTNNNSNNSLTSQAEVSSMGLKFVPFPFLIVGVLAFLIIVILYFTLSVFIVPLVIAMTGLVVVLCAVTTLVVLIVTQSLFVGDYKKQLFISFVILAAGLVILLVLNIIITIIYCCKNGKFSSILIILLSTLINFSIFQILNSNISNTFSSFKNKNHSFWKFYNYLTKISILSYFSFIAASMVLIFELNTSEYLYYSCIELTILSLIHIGFAVVGLLSKKVDNDIDENQPSYQVDDSFQQLQNFSINQKGSNSERNSNLTVHAKSQTPFQSSNSHLKKQTNMKKTKSQFLPSHKKSQVIDFLTSYEKKDTKNQFFTQSLKDQKRKQQSNIHDRSFFDSASKMNKKKPSQKEQINTTLTNQLNIFDIGDQFQQYRSQNLIIGGQKKKDLKRKRRPMHQQKSFNPKIQVNGIVKNDVQLLAKVSINDLPLDSQELQILESTETQNKKSKVEESNNDQSFLHSNPKSNIIFETINEDALQYKFDTKGSRNETHLGTQQDEIQSIDIFKHQTNLNQQQLVSQTHSLSTQLIENQQKLVRNDLQIGKDENIFVLKNDLQNQENQDKDLQNKQFQKQIVVNEQVKNQIQIEELQSIYTVQDNNLIQNQHKSQGKIYLAQTKIQKAAQHTEKLHQTISLNDSLVEDIQDFSEDNQKPSNYFFKSPVKNVLSDSKSGGDMPIGLKPLKRDKKFHISSKKNQPK